MTRFRFAAFASLLASAGVGAATVSGCSSSSSSAGGGDAGPAAVVGGGVDAGADASKGFKLQWLVAPGGHTPGLYEGGTSAEAGSPDAAATDEAGVDAAAYGAAEGGSSGDGGVAGLEGVKVCVYQHPDIACTMTAADGTFTLEGLPPLTAMAITLDKTGYYSTLLSISTASIDMDSRQYPVYMADTTGGPPPIGATVDWTNKGQLATFILGHSPTGYGDFGGEPGATMSLAPMSGNGPFYLTSGDIVPGATAYTGIAGAYYNLAPGMYTLTYVDPDPMQDCEAIGFPFDARGIAGAMGSHQVSFPIVAGYITGNVGEICTTKSKIVSVDGGGSGG